MLSCRRWVLKVVQGQIDRRLQTPEARHPMVELCSAQWESSVLAHLRDRVSIYWLSPMLASRSSPKRSSSCLLT